MLTAKRAIAFSWVYHLYDDLLGSETLVWFDPISFILGDLEKNYVPYIGKSLKY